MKKTFLILSICLALFAFNACEKEGSAEKAGKQLDQAAQEAGEAMGKAADDFKKAFK